MNGTLLNLRNTKLNSDHLIEGESYMLDSTFNNSGVVKLISKSVLFGIVEDEDTGTQWETMLYRLSPLSQNYVTSTS